MIARARSVLGSVGHRGKQGGQQEDESLADVAPKSTSNQETDRRQCLLLLVVDLGASRLRLGASSEQRPVTRAKKTAASDERRAQLHALHLDSFITQRTPRKL